MNMRLILIYSSSKPRIPKSKIKELSSRNTIIKFIPITSETPNSSPRLELYGYDGNLKYTSSKISTRDNLIKALETCIAKIDKMPMGHLELLIRNSSNKNKQHNKHTTLKGRYANTTRSKLLRKCGLPDIPETSHCFADTTHHTCCMLGSNSREYADASGNPIGSLSVKVKAIKNSARTSKISKKSKKVLTPWCTCTGSKVCTYYTNKFGADDGTHIKFIGTLSNTTRNSNNKNNNAKNEEKAIDKLELHRHSTLGVIL